MKRLKIKESNPADNIVTEEDLEHMKQVKNEMIDQILGHMTLRDYFAGQALACRDLLEGMDWVNAETVAREAYKLADAMIAERSKP